MGQKSVTPGWRLGVEHIDRVPSKVTVIQPFDDGSRVDNTRPRRVDEHGVRSHTGQGARVDEVMRLSSVRDVQGNGVRRAQNLVQTDPAHSRTQVWGHRVVAKNFHAHGAAQGGRVSPNRAKPHNTKRPTVQH